jgi:F0F1-type ATP synthase epsilon subunit
MAQEHRKFTLSVMSERAILYYGECSVVFVPGRKESIAILPQHTPMIMKLEPGSISMKLDHTTTNLGEIKSGIVYVADDAVSILTDL